MTTFHHPPRPVDLVPSTVLRRVTDRLMFLSNLAHYVAMDDDDLLRATKVFLKNLERIDDDSDDPDNDLQLILIPEIWERIRPGTRDDLRRISSTLAEYRPDPEHPSIFARLLGPETMANLRESADKLRRRIANASHADVGTLVEQVRFAIAGSRVAARWAPTDCVYAPGFVYRLVPVVACRGLERASTRAILGRRSRALFIV
jgi:hypothetical protein